MVRNRLLNLVMLFKLMIIVLNWYHAHALPVTVLNPNTPAVTLPSYPPFPRPTTTPLTPLEGEETTHDTLPSTLSLPQPAQTSLSIVTPPRVTEGILRDAYRAGVRAVWLEPGAFDYDSIRYARRKFDVAVGGSESIWSILNEGEDAMRRARQQMRVKECARREEREKTTEIEKVEVNGEVKEIKKRRGKHEPRAQEGQSTEQSGDSIRLPRYSSL